ncbi:MAG: HAMP domain-containing histidine kinase [Rhodocyclales bacterium]|nr:HAMP domain-containing histidine kinase [Rhodocyclales bacterium]
MSATLDNDAFDRDYTLAELLPEPLCKAVGPALAHLLGADCAVLDADGAALWGSAPAGAARAPLTLELEPIGWLAAAVPAERLRAAATLLRQLCLARVRYLMAGALHTESVAADYRALLEKHAALEVSEARYKLLSEELEQRVAATVKLLDERQRQLYQAEKLASVGQLAAGVAHEINNPIGFVRSNVATLGRYLDTWRGLKARLADAPAAWQELDLDFILTDSADIVQDSIAGIDRVARIVADLRGFSNVDRPEEEVADLNPNIEDVASVVRGQLPAGVALQLDLHPLPRILCLPGHINQVLHSVIRNAVQAVQDGGRPGTVTVRSQAAGDGVDIAVADTGVGMSAEQLTRVFEPFYTTRGVGQGTGLGMTVAKDIVQAHDGRISISSQPQAGTTVTIHLPA